MPAFSYEAATAAGRTIRGVQEAGSADALERELTASGLFPLEIRIAPPPAPASARGWRGRNADVVEAARYLATLLEAGFPLDRAIASVARIAARGDVAEALLQVRERVRGGARLSDALAEHPRIFPRLAVGMARAGERGGHLGEAFARLADQLERAHQLRGQLLSAMLYPLVILLVGGAALAVLLLLLLPRFVVLLEDVGADLPRSTALLLATAGLMERWWWVLLLALLAGVLGLGAARRSPEGRVAIDRLLLRLPIVGRIRQRAACVRLGYALSTLLGSGFPILPALEIAADAQADSATARDLRRVRDELKGGERLATALSRSGMYPYLFVQMVAVGEDGGRLPEMLARAARAMETELESVLGRLIRLVEPVLIVAFGGAVAFVALSILQAIYGIRADSF